MDLRGGACSHPNRYSVRRPPTGRTFCLPSPAEPLFPGLTFCLFSSCLPRLNLCSLVSPSASSSPAPLLSGWPSGTAAAAGAARTAFVAGRSYQRMGPHPPRGGHRRPRHRGLVHWRGCSIKWSLVQAIGRKSTALGGAWGRGEEQSTRSGIDDITFREPHSVECRMQAGGTAGKTHLHLAVPARTLARPCRWRQSSVLPPSKTTRQGR